MKAVLKFFLYVLYLVFITIIGLEAILRFYFPIPRQVSSSGIVLPKNQKYALPNSHFKKLKRNGTHTKNNVGFRGPDFDSTSNLQKILTIGGSTTECFYTDDKNTWSYHLANKLNQNGLNYWLNNAGLNGHSSLGHLKLCESYLPIIKPDYALFLVGINDLIIAESKENAFDTKFDQNSTGSKFFKLAEKSRVLNLMISAYRSYKSYKFGLSDKIEWVLKPNYNNLVSKYTKIEDVQAYLPAYRARIKSIVDLCYKNKCKPVFVSQPLLFGYGIDPISGVDLGRQLVYEMKGAEYWTKITLLNTCLEEICKKENIAFIDLANKMPKSSLYFYDDMHFSDIGSVKVANIIVEELQKNNMLKK